MMKAGGIGRLGGVTKLLQTQCRDSPIVYAGFCEWWSLPFVFRGAGGPRLLYHPGIYF